MVTIAIADKELEFKTKPDLFSPKSLDQGTALLLKRLQQEQYDTALDWGCGWGVIGITLAAKNPQAEVWALDANIGAAKITEENAAQNQITNLKVLASDSYGELPKDLRFDLIASNPPTHQGRGVVDSMIAESLDWLKDGGRLYLVVEARLKPWVARGMQKTFGNYKIIKRGPKNVVLVSTKTV